MDVTVFGASGFIGSVVAKELKTMGHKVSTPSREAIGAAPPSNGYGTIVWAAGLTAGFRTRPLETADAHVSALARVLARNAHDRVVFLSSCRVYQRATTTHEGAELPVLSSDPSHLYNITKLAGEALCQACAPGRATIARLSNVVGPEEVARDTFLGAICREALAGKIRLQTAMASRKDYIWIDDVATVLARLATGEGQHSVYNIARGIQSTHAEWVEMIAARTGADVEMQTDAPETSFPTIDVARLSAEFPMTFADPFDHVDSLLSLRDKSGQMSTT